jgi:uncharacterized membrane protein YkgB
MDLQLGGKVAVFAYSLLRAVIVSLALLLCLHPWMPGAAALGGFLVFGMSFGTLSFLITPPNAGCPPLAIRITDSHSCPEPDALS